MTNVSKCMSVWVVGGAVASIALAAGCGSKSELREWTPADHQAPPAVAPEGQGAGEAPAEGQNVAQAAAALWTTRCASCHGEIGRGDGSGRPPGAALPDMSQANFQNQRTDAQLAEVITNGRGMMPGFGAELTEAGVSALVQQVRRFGAPAP